MKGVVGSIIECGVGLDTSNAAWVEFKCGVGWIDEMRLDRSNAVWGWIDVMRCGLDRWNAMWVG